MRFLFIIFEFSFYIRSKLEQTKIRDFFYTLNKQNDDLNSIQTNDIYLCYFLIIKILKKIYTVASNFFEQIYDDILKFIDYT